MTGFQCSKNVRPGRRFNEFRMSVNRGVIALRHFDQGIAKTSHIICRYAVCPAEGCDGVIIPAFEADDKKLFLEQSRTWYLLCPVCQRPFKITDSQLKTQEISLNRILQVYPNKG